MKKIYSKNGVTFAYTCNPFNNRAVTIEDIEVEPGIKSVRFEMPNISNITIKLRDVMKQFPDVEELYLSSQVYTARISNFMFPNVKEVTSNSRLFISGPCLTRKQRKETVLLNTFCRRDFQTLDLTGYSHIAANALEGSYITEIVHDEGIRYFGEMFNGIEAKPGDMFNGTIMKMNPHAFYKNGIYSIGNVLLTVDEDAKEVRIPATISKIAKNNLFSHCEKVYLDSVQKLADLSSFLRGKEVVIDSEELIDFITINRCLNECRLSISDKSPFYCSKDGSIYDKSMTRLISYNMTDECINIPEGVTEIMDYACYKHNAKSVKLPSSLKVIHREAFGRSDIEELIMENVETIEPHAFSYCPLNYIEIPGTLKVIQKDAFVSRDNKTRLVLHEGIEQIDARAFKALNVTEIHIPESVKYIGDKALSPYTSDIYVKENYPVNLINGMDLRARTKSELDKEYQGLYCVHIENYGDVYLPNQMDSDNVEFLNYQFDLRNLDKEYTNYLYEYASDVRSKQDTAIMVFDKINDEEIGQYLRRAAASIIKRLIHENKPNILIKFIETGLTTLNTLKKTLKTLPDNMPTVKAYLLEKINEDNKSSSFKL